VLRLFGFLVLGLVGAGGILFLDFQRVVQEASAAEAPPPSFQTYLETVPTKLASLTEAAQPATPGLELAQMLPRAPEGWTMRPLADGDLEGFLPKGREKGDPDKVAKVKAATSSRVERGATVAIQAYERGERRVVVQLVRLPDEIFTDPGASDRRYDLQIAAAELRGRPFLTVRGMDVTEEFLGDGMRARFFSASVGAQIQVRVLASRRLKDGDLVPFFQTLNVEAMNDAVIDRQPGLGAVPVLVLGSALSEADLSAYEADRAARAEMAVQRARDLRDMARAELAATADATEAIPAGEAKPLSSECKKDSGGIKRCSVATGG
jgi:hypothetical protein